MILHSQCWASASWRVLAGSQSPHHIELSQAPIGSQFLPISKSYSVDKGEDGQALWFPCALIPTPASDSFSQGRIFTSSWDPILSARGGGAQPACE